MRSFAVVCVFAAALCAAAAIAVGAEGLEARYEKEMLVDLPESVAECRFAIRPLSFPEVSQESWFETGKKCQEEVLTFLCERKQAARGASRAQLKSDPELRNYADLADVVFSWTWGSQPRVALYDISSNGRRRVGLKYYLRYDRGTKEYRCDLERGASDDAAVLGAQMSRNLEAERFVAAPTWPPRPLP